jgi:hypothetical protein
MRQIRNTLVAAAIVGATALATLSPANAWGGRWGPGPFWGGVAAGAVAGAVVGSAIASRPYYPYGYYGPYPRCPAVWNGYAWVRSCY